MNEELKNPYSPLTGISMDNAKKSVVEVASTLGLPAGEPASQSAEKIGGNNTDLQTALQALIDARSRQAKGRGLAMTGEIGGQRFNNPRQYYEAALELVIQFAKSMENFVENKVRNNNELTEPQKKWLAQQLINDERLGWISSLDLIDLAIKNNGGRIAITIGNELTHFFYPEMTIDDFAQRHVTSNDRLSDQSKAYVMNLLKSGELSPSSYTSEIYDDNGRVVVASPEVQRYFYPDSLQDDINQIRLFQPGTLQSYN